MTDTKKSFYIVGQPQLSPIEELVKLTDELNRCPETIKELQQHEQQICDPKFYLRNGDHFEELTLLKRAIKNAHVRLPCGTKQCLPAKYLEEHGKYTRHLRKFDREFYCGWRARKYLLLRIDETEKWSTRLKKILIPDLVRWIRKSGGTIPKEILQKLVPHYRSDE